jgi:hypothetical protein
LVVPIFFSIFAKKILLIMNMGKVLVFIITLIVFLVITIGLTYFSFHYIYKEGVFHPWYEYFCYVICVLLSIGYALMYSKV